MEVKNSQLSLCVLDSGKRGKRYTGKTLYMLMARIERSRMRIVFPSLAAVELMARRYLDSAYAEPERRGAKSFYFIVDSRISSAKREEFLAAIFRHTKLRPKRPSRRER
jgi:hypothetical protein